MLALIIPRVDKSAKPCLLSRRFIFILSLVFSLGPWYSRFLSHVCNPDYSITYPISLANKTMRCWHSFILILSVHLRPTSSITCFNPDGTSDSRDNFKPCYSLEDGASMCCALSDECLWNGLCKVSAARGVRRIQHIGGICAPNGTGRRWVV